MLEGTINAEGARTRSGGSSTRCSLSLGTPTTPITLCKKNFKSCRAKKKEIVKKQQKMSWKERSHDASGPILTLLTVAP